MRYAAQTSVSCAKSQGEIQDILMRYGASKYAFVQQEAFAMIGFEAKGRQIRFILPLPPMSDFKERPFRTWKTKCTPEEQAKLWEQACRQRWRALALAIKAKLEAVECGIATFEEEFLAHIVLPGGFTVAQEIIPKIKAAYESGEVAPLMLGMGAGQVK